MHYVLFILFSDVLYCEIATTDKLVFNFLKTWLRLEFSSGKLEEGIMKDLEVAYQVRIFHWTGYIMEILLHLTQLPPLYRLIRKLELWKLPRQGFGVSLLTGGHPLFYNLLLLYFLLYYIHIYIHYYILYINNIAVWSISH